jgi:hypothetical protein
VAHVRLDQSQYTILVTAVIGSAVVADVQEAEAVAGEEP